jgi:hypothetical protein
MNSTSFLDPFLPRSTMNCEYSRGVMGVKFPGNVEIGLRLGENEVGIFTVSRWQEDSLYS